MVCATLSSSEYLEIIKLEYFPTLLTSIIVAFMHVKALDPQIPAGTYIANGEGTTWQDATRIVAEKFPEAVAKGILPNNGIQGTRAAKIDGKRSEELFGLKFRSFEEQVESVVGHYLELHGEQKA